MYRYSRLCKQVVPPPFLYGIRNPLVSGIIRFNEEISAESKRVISTEYFNRALVYVDDIDTIEVVSDDSVSRADDPTHIEAGVGVVLKTSVRMGPNLPSVPCGVVAAFQSVGEGNNNMRFHAHQAKTICQFYAREYIGDKGIVLTVGEGNNWINEIKLIKNDFLNIFSKKFWKNKEDKWNKNDFKIEKINNNSLFLNYIHFPISTQSTLALIDQSGSILCGGNCYLSSDRKLVITDPFITMDCMDGTEKESIEVFGEQLIALPEFSLCKSVVVRYSPSDRMMEKIFAPDDTPVSSQFSIESVGLSSEEQVMLLKRPWLTSGIV